MVLVIILVKVWVKVMVLVEYFVCVSYWIRMKKLLQNCRWRANERKLFIYLNNKTVYIVIVSVYFRFKRYFRGGFRQGQAPELSELHLSGSCKNGGQRLLVFSLCALSLLFSDDNPSFLPTYLLAYSPPSIQRRRTAVSFVYNNLSDCYLHSCHRVFD